MSGLLESDLPFQSADRGYIKLFNKDRNRLGQEFREFFIGRHNYAQAIIAPPSTSNTNRIPSHNCGFQIIVSPNP